MADELPMIYASCVFVFCVVEEDLVRRTGRLLIAGLVLYAVLVTVIYLYWQNHVFFLICYGIQVRKHDSIVSPPFPLLIVIPGNQKERRRSIRFLFMN